MSSQRIPGQESRDPDRQAEGSRGAVDAGISILSRPVTIQTPVSANFGPNALTRPVADVILLSKDSVSFYVDEYSLLLFSTNNFNGLLPILDQGPEDRLIFLHDLHSSKLDIALQAIYKIPATSVSATGGGNLEELELLARGVGWLATFGIPARLVVLPYTHIFDRILSFAPLYPLVSYAIAGHHELEELAIAVSPHTLPVELSNVTEELAEQMGVKYLRRLFRLQLDRQDILMGLLRPEPEIHTPTQQCSLEDQRVLKTKWDMAISSLVRVVRADTTTNLIREVVTTFTSDVACENCLRARDTRLNTILTEWSMSLRTI
ncbi:hypothetical protein VNI00_004175 [Paramarasmius palmivorus]|uniref:Uncharacterized protein n=1 Tax=Paramarasmius palmivorus TaxID=297713 RepID=A0AAW0DK39_9AGAR